MYLVIWYFFWVGICAIFGKLKSCDPHSDKNCSTLDAWIGTGVATLLLIFLGNFSSAGYSVPAQNDVRKHKKVKKTDNTDVYGI
jgi:hypothetical protein